MEPLFNASVYYIAAAIFFLINYYLAKMQYYTTVCMHDHKPNPSAEHVNAMKIDQVNGDAK